MGRSGSAMELSATLLVLLHLSMHVVDEGHAVNPSCTCIRYTSTYGKERGTFSSPDYPHPYPPHVDCLLYTFVAAPHEIIEIVFTDFDIYKEHLDCTRGDYLKVYWEVQGPGPPGAVNERSAWARELCGSRADAPPALYSPGPSLVLEFHSGPKQNNATGFVGTYTFIDRLDIKIKAIPDVQASVPIVLYNCEVVQDYFPTSKMNKTFFVVLAVCLVSAQAFVKRDAPADSKNYIENFQKQMQEMSANIGEKMKTAFDPNTIKKNFNEFIDNTNKAFQSMQPKQ